MFAGRQERADLERRDKNLLDRGAAAADAAQTKGLGRSVATRLPQLLAGNSSIRRKHEAPGTAIAPEQVR